MIFAASAVMDCEILKNPCPSTAANLNASAAPPRNNLSLVSNSVKPTLRQGSRGAAVEQLQSKLSQLGHNPGRADGIFGPNTKSAVRDFQREQGLGVDGVVGRQTWSALDSARSATDASTNAASHADRGRGSSPPSAPLPEYRSRPPRAGPRWRSPCPSELRPANSRFRLHG